MSKKPPKPYDHQKASLAFIAKTPRVLDASDPGTGKTRVQIDAFVERFKKNKKKALVIAPKSLLHSAWEEDFNKFAPHIRVSVAKASNRAEAFAEDADVYVTNTDAATWLVKQPASFFKQFDTLIIDEISMFKHATSQRSKAIAKIKKYFKYRAGLTGTPNANKITDVWHPVFLIDDGQRLGTSFYKFRASVCEPKQVGPRANMVQWTDKPGAELAVAQLISDITIRHEFEKCIDIPANHQYTMSYELPPAQMKSYRSLEKTAMSSFADGKVVTAVNAAVLSNKLLQIASGAIYTDTTYTIDDNETILFNQREHSIVNTERYELVADLVAARNHSIVFFLWEHQRDALIAQFEKQGISYAVIDGKVGDNDRRRAVEEYQAGMYQALLVHPASAAHGLTLTKGTTTIWASPTSNLEWFIQGNRRTYRAGQTEKTETITIVAKGTIEEHVYQRLTDKNTVQASALSILETIFSEGK